VIRASDDENASRNTSRRQPRITAAIEERANHLPIRRLGKAEEFARVTLFLAAPESGYMSGAT